ATAVSSAGTVRNGVVRPRAGMTASYRRSVLFKPDPGVLYARGETQLPSIQSTRLGPGRVLAHSLPLASRTQSRTPRGTTGDGSASGHPDKMPSPRTLPSIPSTTTA